MLDLCILIAVHKIHDMSLQNQQQHIFISIIFFPECHPFRRLQLLYDLLQHSAFLMESMFESITSDIPLSLFFSKKSHIRQQIGINRIQLADGLRLFCLLVKKA